MDKIIRNEGAPKRATKRAPRFCPWRECVVRYLDFTISKDTGPWHLGLAFIYIILEYLKLSA